MAFKVALVAHDHDVPACISERICNAVITFVAEKCATADDLRRVAADADAVWIFAASHPVTAQNLPLLERCGAIIRTGSGTDNVPVAEATSRGIIVATTPDAVTVGVSDHAIALLFALGRQIVPQHNAVKSGRWPTWESFPDFTLEGRTIGLLGFGRTARAVARKLSGFDANFVAFDPMVPAQETEALAVRSVSLPELCAESDVMSIHCPLTPQTCHVIGSEQFRAMKPSALFVNTSRGPVVDEPALIEALQQKRIAGAALDVLEQEPPATDNPLLKMPNVIVTPHTAGFSGVFWQQMWGLSAEAAIDLAQGRWPRSYVNRPVESRWPLQTHAQGC